jgi:hypothetical protein
MKKYNMSKVCLLILGLGCFWQALSLPGIKEDGSLDKETISNFYFEGNFVKVVEALEHFRDNNPDASKEDMIFVLKHLSVVYASQDETREKAESFMYQLLKLEPNIDLIDMYVSDNIEAIFNKVKERHNRLTPPSGVGGKMAESNESTSSGKGKPKPEKKSKKWLLWAAGGTALAAGFTAFILFSGEEESQKTRTLDPIILP